MQLNGLEDLEQLVSSTGIVSFMELVDGILSWPDTGTESMGRTHIQACQVIVNEFAAARNLDLEVNYEWPRHLELEWSRLVRELQIANGQNHL